ncbi:hypothetical protein Tco_1295973 [Tanacetum coccineum]
MITYLKNMDRFTYNQLKNRSLEEIQMLYEKEQKWINDFVPMDSKEGVKKAESIKKEAASSKKRQRANPDDENVKRHKTGEASCHTPPKAESQSMINRHHHNTRRQKREN